MNTPHISVRVPKETQDRWKTSCAYMDTDVSTMVRAFMDAYSDKVLAQKEMKEMLVDFRDPRESAVV